MRRLSRLLQIVTVATVAVAGAASAKPGPHASVPSPASGDIGEIMNPANPYNGGTDPVTMPEDARIAVFPYSDDQIFKLLTAPLKTTSIEFAKDERLASDPALADSLQWDIDTDGANHVYVKPHKPDLVNTLEVVTNKRTYDFTLVSSPMGGLFYQRVKFRYGESILTKLNKGSTSSRAGEGSAASSDLAAVDESVLPGVTPEKMNTLYTVSGAAGFKPDLVFDDGKFMYMRIPESSQIWPIPMLLEHGDTVTPNFIRRGRFIVIERLADEVVLQSGEDKVTVERKSKRLFGLF
ncbi:type IV secretion system protein TrbG (plasmid) [Pararobbsia alpina]|uniref:TrbG/VirB9 family P-type conjugative transfer protein n=1 Tax=Pararobbsia alpina TaxID=621374 RepID=UPI0039A67817